MVNIFIAKKVLHHLSLQDSLCINLQYKKINVTTSRVVTILEGFKDFAMYLKVSGFRRIWIEYDFLIFRLKKPINF